MARKYLTCAETAKLCRQSLKEAFPSIKFSVRSSTYSGGASIRIYWTDGPTSDQVKSVIAPFEGGYFDGLIDYKGSVYAMLDGEQVHFGADFIFEERSNSDKAVLSAIDRVYRHYEGNFLRDGIAKPTLEQFRKGNLWNAQLSGLHHYGDQSVQCEINRALSKHTYTITGTSKTAARCFVTHDDGYSRSCGSGMSAIGEV